MFGFLEEVLLEVGLFVVVGLDVGLFLDLDRLLDIFLCGVGFLFLRDIVNGWLEFGLNFFFDRFFDVLWIEFDGLGLFCFVVGRIVIFCLVLFCFFCLFFVGIGVLVVIFWFCLFFFLLLILLLLFVKLLFFWENLGWFIISIDGWFFFVVVCIVWIGIVWIGRIGMGSSWVCIICIGFILVNIKY